VQHKGKGQHPSDLLAKRKPPAILESEREKAWIPCKG